MTLTFEPQSHSYYWEQERVPSVTTVIRPLDSYYRASERVLRPYAEKGSMVHSLTESYDILGEAPEDMNPDLAGYLKAWVDFRQDHGFIPTHIEHRFFHPIYRYAGTVDRFGVVRGRMAVVDIKTSTRLGPAVGVQLAAYQQAGNYELGKEVVERRYAVQLMTDGTYRLVEYADPLDWQAFLACLTLHDWQAQHKTTIQLADVRPRISSGSTWPQFAREARRVQQ